MKKTKLQKGITLIALIITIVVLLVLAVVTIGAVQNDGIITHALNASRKYKKAKIQEELNNIITSMNLDIAANPDEYTVTGKEAKENEAAIYYLLMVTPLEKIEEYFEVDDSIIITDEINNDDGTTETIAGLDFEKMGELGLISVITNGDVEDATGYIITVPCTYEETDVNIIVKIELINETAVKLTSFELEEKETTSVYVSSETPSLTAGGNIKEVTSDGVPIPTGFYYVTGTRNTGVVISTDPLDENNASGNNGNQFVWVPVNVNPVLNIVLDESKTISKVQILSTDGYDETITVNSDYFEKTIALTKNGAYEIIVTYNDGTTKDILKNVDSVYAKPYDGYNSADGGVELLNMAGESYTIDSLLEELLKTELEKNPSLEINNTIDYIKLYQEIFFDKYSDDVTEASNVLKYGGFYVGRYEAYIDDNNNFTVKKGIKPRASVTYDEAVSAIASESTKLNGMQFDLPSAAAWSAIGNWLIDSNSKTRYEVYSTSISWGNSKHSFTEKTDVKYTGSSENYRANNIYDLAGNLYELTKEINTETGEHIARGSSYITITPTVFGRNEVSKAEDYTGFRPILYFSE